jgi:hypothetical protein
VHLVQRLRPGEGACLPIISLVRAKRRRASSQVIDRLRQFVPQPLQTSMLPGPMTHRPVALVISISLGKSRRALELLEAFGDRPFLFRTVYL